MLITVNEKIKKNKSNLSHSEIISLNNLFVLHIERDFDGNPLNICVCRVYISAIGSCKMSDRCGMISFAETLTGFQGSEHWIILIFCQVCRCSCFWKWGSSLCILPYVCILGSAFLAPVARFMWVSHPAWFMCTTNLSSGILLIMLISGINSLYIVVKWVSWCVIQFLYTQGKLI